MKTLIKDALFDAGYLETSKLKEVFGFPPFSIFDTTSGDWIKRRNDKKIKDNFSKVVDFKIGDVVLNALYEAKCKEFIKENDLLWIIGK